MTSSCEVCLIEGIEDFEKAYFKKTKTKNKIIDELKIDNYKWYKHINNHVKPIVLANVNEQQPELARDYIDKFGDLLELLEAEKAKAREITESISESSDPRKINAWVSVNAEIRKTVETIAKLQGEMTTHAQTTNNTLNIELKDITEHVLQNTCVKCKAKLAESLPNIIKKVNEVLP